MKKSSLILITIILIFSFSACSMIPGNTLFVSVRYGDSNIYTDQDIELAVKVIQKHFRKHFNGCKLYSIEYEGDKVALDSLDYVNTLNDEAEYIDAIVFTSDFRSHKHYLEDSGFMPNELYEDWSWYLAREEGGNWELLTWGYG